MDTMVIFYKAQIVDSQSGPFGLLAKANLEIIGFDEFLGWFDW